MFTWFHVNLMRVRSLPHLWFLGAWHVWFVDIMCYCVPAGRCFFDILCAWSPQEAAAESDLGQVHPTVRLMVYHPIPHFPYDCLLIIIYEYLTRMVSTGAANRAYRASLFHGHEVPDVRANTKVGDVRYQQYVMPESEREEGRSY